MRIVSERNPCELVPDQPECRTDHAVFFCENADESLRSGAEQPFEPTDVEPYRLQDTP